MTRVPSELDLHPSNADDVPQWSLGTPRWLGRATTVAPRSRVIIDNDFAGDPDDLLQIVHHLLSPSIDIRAIICSHDQDVADRASAAEALRVAQDVFRRMGITDQHLLAQGADLPLADSTSPRHSAALRVIVDEAARNDPRPLFYAAGAGLTDLASAYLVDPTIADRMTVVWIGGLQHDDVVGTPGRYTEEYNRDLDLAAAQIVFSAGFEIWQVPRNLYRECVMAESELRRRVARDGGPLGEYLYAEIRHVLDGLAASIGRAEMYPMGDQPLVLLTVLQGVVDQDDDFSSNAYVTKPTPRLSAEGTYLEQTESRPMRVYTRLDHRLMFEDFFSKLSEFADWQRTAASAE